MFGYGAIIIKPALSDKNGYASALDMDDVKQTKKQVCALERFEIKKICVVTGHHALAYKTSLKSTHAVVLSRNPEESLLSMAREGIRQIKNCCDYVFVLENYQADIHTETIKDMIEKNKDVVTLTDSGNTGSIVLLAPHMVDWCLKYNGNRGLEGAWKSLIDIGIASSVSVQLREETKEVPSVYKYKTVINWI